MNINKYNQEWIDKFTYAYNKNLPILIDAFVILYGEEHRSEIEFRLQNIKFIYTLCEKAFSSVNNYSYKDIRIVKMYLNYFKRKSKIIKYYRKLGYPESFITNKYTKDNVISNVKGRRANKMLKMFIGNNDADAAMFLLPNNNDVDYYVIVSVFALNDLTLIHELNHTMAENIIFQEEDTYGEIVVFKNDESTELINDLMAREIYQNFLKLGGNISTMCYYKEFESICYYSDKLWLMKPFYEKFKKLIKESYITKNTNLMEKSLGKHNYDTFLDLIKVLYNKEKVTNIDIKKRDLLIKLMEEHLIKEQDYNYEEFLLELQEKGLSVRKLNL